jgi:hypothetical protein
MIKFLLIKFLHQPLMERPTLESGLGLLVHHKIIGSGHAATQEVLASGLLRQSSLYGLIIEKSLQILAPSAKNGLSQTPID